MIDKIKESLYKIYKPTDLVGVFLSAFDDTGRLLVSQGVLRSDKPLEKTIQLLYDAFLANQKNIKLVVCDVILSIYEENNTENLLRASMKEYGIALVTLDGTVSGVLLPGTEGVADAKNALFLVKKKYNIEGKVKVYLIKTEKIAVTNIIS